MALFKHSPFVPPLSLSSPDPDPEPPPLTSASYLLTIVALRDETLVLLVSSSHLRSLYLYNSFSTDPMEPQRTRYLNLSFKLLKILVPEHEPFLFLLASPDHPNLSPKSVAKATSVKPYTPQLVLCPVSLLLSSLNFSSSKSSLERPVINHLSLVAAALVINLKIKLLLWQSLSCDNNRGWLSKLESFSPLTLLMDVNDNLLNLILGLCVYFPSILLLDVCITLLELILISLHIVHKCRCSGPFLPITRSLFLCSPLHKLDPNLLIVYVLKLRLYYIVVCGSLLYLKIRMETSSLRPVSPSIGPWRLYRCSHDTRLAHGWEGPSMDDSLSATIKGSILMSVADCLIASLALGDEAVWILRPPGVLSSPLDVPLLLKISIA